MLAVTTFSPEGYERYGHKCVKGLSEFFPGKVIAYVESPIETPVETRDFNSIPGVVEYLDRLKRQPGADGRTNGAYDFRYDASKFCRKVFAQDAVFDESEYVYWFDADCVIHKPIPEDFLKAVFKNTALAYMGRGRFEDKHSYTETGWIGFHTKHHDFQKFRDAYLPYFTSGRIFSQLKGWHDCIAFDYARQGVSGRNLSPGHHGMVSVIQETMLAPYISHLKGNRKFK